MVGDCIVQFITACYPARRCVAKDNVPVSGHYALAAANLSRARAGKVTSGGVAALDAGEAERLDLERLWDNGKEAALAREIGEAHCDSLPDSMLRGIALAQRARDAVMADTLARAGPAGAVLIAGDGQCAARLRRAARIVANGQIEVEAGKSTPQDYAVTVGAARPLYLRLRAVHAAGQARGSLRGLSSRRGDGWPETMNMASAMRPSPGREPGTASGRAVLGALGSGRVRGTAPSRAMSGFACCRLSRVFHEPCRG